MSTPSHFSRRDLCRIGLLGLPLTTLIARSLASSTALAEQKKGAKTAEQPTAAAKGAPAECAKDAKIAVPGEGLAKSFQYVAKTPDAAKACGGCAQFNDKSQCTASGKTVAPCNIMSGALVEVGGTCAVFAPRPA